MINQALDFVKMLNTLKVTRFVDGEVPTVYLDGAKYYSLFNVYPETIVCVAGVVFKPEEDTRCTSCCGRGGEWFDTCPVCEGSGSAVRKGYNRGRT